MDSLMRAIRLYDDEVSEEKLDKETVDLLEEITTEV